MRNVGRPKVEITELPINWHNTLIENAQAGASMVELRLALGLSKTVWYRLKKENPDFEEATEEARDCSQVFWERLGRGLATGAVQGNATAFIFQMKNRFNYKNEPKQPVDDDASQKMPTSVIFQICGVKPKHNFGADDNYDDN